MKPRHLVGVGCVLVKTPGSARGIVQCRKTAISAVTSLLVSKVRARLLNERDHRSFAKQITQFPWKQPFRENRQESSISCNFKLRFHANVRRLSSKRTIIFLVHIANVSNGSLPDPKSRREITGRLCRAKKMSLESSRATSLAVNFLNNPYKQIFSCVYIYILFFLLIDKTNPTYFSWRDARKHILRVQGMESAEQDKDRWIDINSLISDPYEN